MMSLHTAMRTLQRFMDTCRDNGVMNTGDVIIKWDASAAPADLNNESSYAQQSMQSVTVSAFIHYISAKAAASGYTTYQQGDVLVTFDAASLDLTNKRTVSFVLPDNIVYVQETTGKDPAEFWSTFIGGTPLTFTLHLRRVP